MSVYRIYVEKKPEFAVEANSLIGGIKSALGLDNLTGLRVINRYDAEGLSREDFDLAAPVVFSEPAVDVTYDHLPAVKADEFVFAVEYLPGQFDQRADSCAQCISLLTGGKRPTIKSARIYIVSGKLTEAELDQIKHYMINPVESREASLDCFDTLDIKYTIPTTVKTVEGFIYSTDDDLRFMLTDLGLAMDFDDIKFCQDYFKNVEKRNPTITEIRMIDTYWSDHCRHTTFSTIVDNVSIDSDYIAATFADYINTRKDLYAGRTDKPVTLMDLACIGAKQLKKAGLLKDLDESEEINACSVKITVDVDGKPEDWLLMFKNETHNHPTEIEPFGGAATCLGGAIRDPLSGRSYVYQAMRVTGAGNPLVPVEDTITGKLPQRKIVVGAANGYSSYGNQIGLATGHVHEIYHPGYVAKRMEIGAVVGAAPAENVRRERPEPEDIVILLGGRTGRDGCGGATGSSKSHNLHSLENCGAEVQKGNAPEERKLQRLFRNPEVTSMIKRCNDFGAGGVSVAIGELADGLSINLDAVTKKYDGLDGTELAISESQERMAVVVDRKDVDKMLAYAAEENLEAVPVAEVTPEKRLVMYWRGKKIVDISRAFLDTNGAHQETSVLVDIPDDKANYLEAKPVDDVKGRWLKTLADLNECSQKGLVERFDGSIGAGSVLMPFGGKYQLTETQAMVAKLPVLKGKCDTVTMMAYGFDPYLSKWSPYHGAIYAVTDSVAKIVAAGGDYSKIRFTYQEYFRRMTEDPSRWSQPFAALLGAYEAQIGLGLPSIGGKDSMSGTFEHIDVPPTLCSFAIDVAKEQDIITPELKKAGNILVRFDIERDKYDLPVFSQIKELYSSIHEAIKSKAIVSAYVLDANGLVPAISKMAFGNMLGVAVEPSVSKEELFAPAYGCIVAEVDSSKLSEIKAVYTKVGTVTEEAKFTYEDVSINIEEALSVWKDTLEGVFPTKVSKETDRVESPVYSKGNVYVCKNKVAKPTVFIPVFPGTNCEYDSARAFERAGADTIVKVFKNLDAASIRESVDEFEKAINQSQIIMFPGGFSAGDEPDGSAKFFATAFRNAKMKEAVEKLLNERDGLALGICNGFQALIKLGLVPNGKITGQDSNSPTLTFNTINRHISKMVYTKVVTNKSPWLAEAKLGGVYCNPASHGEGRFVAPKEWLDKLFENGQVATQYCDPEGNVSMDEEWNVNGSYMAIEGITSPDGRCLGKMAHSERRGDSVAINIYGEQDIKIFESGVKYFK